MFRPITIFIATIIATIFLVGFGVGYFYANSRVPEHEDIHQVLNRYIVACNKYPTQGFLNDFLIPQSFDLTIPQIEELLTLVSSAITEEDKNECDFFKPSYVARIEVRGPESEISTIVIAMLSSKEDSSIMVNGKLYKTRERVSNMLGKVLDK
ncbi:MAG: hypothetical protein SFX18_15450 [Pirellulales bacterium]|nr:hypothetical protein [Pirellulales bacterium]